MMAAAAMVGCSMPSAAEAEAGDGAQRAGGNNEPAVVNRHPAGIPRDHSKI
jgi:hypothetical protein